MIHASSCIRFPFYSSDLPGCTFKTKLFPEHAVKFVQYKDVATARLPGGRDGVGREGVTMVVVRGLVVVTG